MHNWFQRWRPHLYTLALTLIVFAADQWSKSAVIDHFEAQGAGIDNLHRVESEPLLGGLVGLRLAKNTGAAFGLFGGGATTPFLLLAVSVIGMAAAVWFYWYYSDTRWLRTAWACAAGGGFGNLLDRLRLGYVVDFIDVDIGAYQWPYFNLADTFLCVGAGMLILSTALDRRKEADA